MYRFRARDSFLFGIGASVLLYVCGSARADVQAIPVPRITLYPGDAITDGVLLDKRFRMPNGSVSTYATSRGQLRGRLARRLLAAGRPIVLNATRGEQLVRQGKPAMAHYIDDGLEISATLIPLKSAEAGETVDARNAETGIVVKSEVQPDGTLRVLNP